MTATVTLSLVFTVAIIISYSSSSFAVDEPDHAPAITPDTEISSGDPKTSVGDQEPSSGAPKTLGDQESSSGDPKSPSSWPQILLPTALLNPDGHPKPAGQLPVELQPDKEQENSDEISRGLPVVNQRRPAGVYSDPAGLYDVKQPQQNPVPNSANKSSGNDSDIILELNPDAEDLEFHHENSTYKQTTPLPNFSAKLYTLSYAGIKKPVLIIQPDLRAATEGQAGPTENNGANIPTFTIHFPLQSNSQFQIPRFNFTLPTLFLPGLVFTQNENVEKNTHEIHVSIPQSSHIFESFPTSHIPAELELLLQAPNFTEAYGENNEQQQFLNNFSPPHEPPHPTSESLPEKYDENEHEVEPPKPYKPEPREPEVETTATLVSHGTSNGFGQKLATEWQPLGTVPLKGHGLEKLAEIKKGSIGAFHNKVHQHGASEDGKPHPSAPGVNQIKYQSASVSPTGSKVQYQPASNIPSANKVQYQPQPVNPALDKMQHQPTSGTPAGNKIQYVPISFAANHPQDQLAHGNSPANEGQYHSPYFNLPTVPAHHQAGLKNPGLHRMPNQPTPSNSAGNHVQHQSSSVNPSVNQASYQMTSPPLNQQYFRPATANNNPGNQGHYHNTPYQPQSGVPGMHEAYFEALAAIPTNNNPYDETVPPSQGQYRPPHQYQDAIVIKDENADYFTSDPHFTAEALPNEGDKASPTGDKNIQGNPGPVQIVPLSDLRPLNAIHTLLSPLNSLAPNITITHPKWQLPSITELYHKIFGTGRTDQNCFDARSEDTDFEELEHDDDPHLCGSNGLCGVTCHRLGFFQGKCVDESACVCLLKSRPEFGLKLEYYEDRRGRAIPGAFPAFGLCHLAACRLNCERNGFLTGVCDNTCLCGSPWAEKMRK